MSDLTELQLEIAAEVTEHADYQVIDWAGPRPQVIAAINAVCLTVRNANQDRYMYAKTQPIAKSLYGFGPGETNGHVVSDDPLRATEPVMSADADHNDDSGNSPPEPVTEVEDDLEPDDPELGIDPSTLAFIENMRKRRDAPPTGIVLPIRSAVSAYREERPEVPWLLKGYIARGAITEIDGRVKEGKTTLVGSVIRAIVTGEKFIDRETTRAKALWVTEEGRMTYLSMLARVDLHHQRDLYILYRREVRDLTWQQLVSKLADDIVVLDIGVVIIDTLAKVAGMKGDDEQSSGAAMQVMAPLQAMTSNLQIATVITRHDRKSGGEVGESGRGSSAFSGDVDIITQVSRDKRAGRHNYRDLRSISRFDETPDELTVLWVLGDKRYRLDNASAIRQEIESDAAFLATQFRRPIWNFVASHPGCSLRAILKDVPGNTDNKRAAIEMMVGSGHVRIDTRGQKSMHFTVKELEADDPSKPYVPTGGWSARPPHMENAS